MSFVMMVGETHRNASGNALWESSKASRATTETPEFKRSAVRNFSLKANPCYTKLREVELALSNTTTILYETNVVKNVF